MKKKTNNFFYWFRVATKWLIPVSYFVIAAAEGKAYWVAGVMTIFTLAYYFLKHRKIGDRLE